jgi:peroxiredoxin
MRDEVEHKADSGAVVVGARRCRDAEGVSVHQLPQDLPAPVDDGACAHLEGMAVPSLELESTLGPIDLAAFGSGRALLYVYPRTGRPGDVIPDSWNAIPGARGCTPQSCGFRDRREELQRLGVQLAGLSTQTQEEQIELSERLGLLHPVIADPELRLREALALPTFEFEGAELYRRVTLILSGGGIEKVFYPVFPPDRNAEEVVAWLGS